MKPSMPLPAEFPLDNTGRVTCATCHKTHGKNPGLLNRTETGEGFCLTCHYEGLENIHASSITGAHSTKNTSKYYIIDKDATVDALSIKCISCHDSTLGSEVNIGVGVWIRKNGGSDPIGVEYRKAYLERGEFVNPSRLDERIRLFNGKVGCGTCHNKYSREPYKLAINNRGSALCLACHRK